MATKMGLLLILTVLIPTLKSQVQLQDKNDLSKEDTSDESKSNHSNDLKSSENSGDTNENRLDDSRLNEKAEHLDPKKKTEHLNPYLKQKEQRNGDILQKQRPSELHSKNTFDEDGRINRSERKSSEHTGHTVLVNEDIKASLDEQTEYCSHINGNTPQLTENDNIYLKDNRPNLNEQKTSEQTRIIEDTRPTLDEQKAEETNIVKGTRPNLDEQKAEETNIMDDTRPSLDEQTTEKTSIVKHRLNPDEQKPEETNIVEDTRPNLDEQKSEETNIVEDTILNLDEQKTDETRIIEERPILDEMNTEHPDSRQLNPEQQRSERLTRLNHVKHKVADNDFPYMVAVMKGTKFLCSGVLIDESWVLTAASGIHLMREMIRLIRMRLGSVNYKKGGIVLPIKDLEIHPDFNSSQPNFDVALAMLAKPVRYTAGVGSIRLQLTPKDVTTTHFIMTSWLGFVKPGMNKSQSNQVIKHHRILSVTHIHPSDPEECLQELTDFGFEGHDGVMCLEGGEYCLRDTGAPVVINGVLWGIISAWKPEDCDDEDSLTFATLVSVRNVSTWIHGVVHGHRWHKKNKLS